MNNNSLGMKIVMAAVAVALTAYFGFQAYNYFTDPLYTTLAYNYVVEEMVPTIRSMSGDKGILTFGCSMGAMHAANLFFRRPDLFCGCFAISGLYDSKEFFGDYCDNLVYNNCPNYYLANMPSDHHYIDMYNHSQILIVCGQGRWEGPLLASTRWLENVMRNKGINGRVDYWGMDVDHDWPWWYKMVDHYVPQLL